MSDEQEKISEVVFETAPPTTGFGKVVNAVKIAFATKKVVMAGWAMFFGVTAGTGAFVGGGMTVDETKARDDMQQTIVKLNEQVIDLQIIVVGLSAEDHEHDVVVPVPVLIPHTHPDIVALTGVFGHEHEDFPSHTHPDMIAIPGPIGPQGPPGKDGKDAENVVVPIVEEKPHFHNEDLHDLLEALSQ